MPNGFSVEPSRRGCLDIEISMTKNQKIFPQCRNRLLAQLPKAEFDHLSPLLEPVPLTAKQVLYKDGSRFRYIYFPTSGVVSAMTVMDNERAIEVPSSLRYRLW